MKVALITAIYDGYDTLKPLVPQDVDVETICVTDDPNLRSEQWAIVCEPRPGVHPNLAAKRPKMLPWAYTDAEIIIWVDASIMVTSPGLARAMGDYLPLGQFAHPDRDCIYDEVAHSIPMPKYAGLPLRAQAEFYRAARHPDRWGLWATGLIARWRTPEIEAFGAAWLAECERWGFQDQVSEPPMLRAHGLAPVTIPGFVRAQQNPWVGYAASARH